MKVIFFEDKEVSNLDPITLTRKPSQISCGGYHLEEMVAAFFRPQEIEYRKICLPIGWKWSQDNLWLNGRTLPWIVSFLKLKKALSFGKREGRLPLLKYPWGVILENERILKDNLTYRMCEYRRDPSGVYLGDNVSLPKQTAIDFTKGPIILDNDVQINPFVSLKGPLYIGPQTKVKEFTKLAASSIGPLCKLAGEIEESVIEGYTNKQHYGFVGHTYLGSWVNLGAGTTFSDLKNTYGEIKVDFGGQRYPLGTQFFGAIVGDYVKTAINTSISSGVLIGPNSFLYGYVGKNVPAFTNFHQERLVEFYLEEAYKVQARMFARRDLKVKKKDREILKSAFEKSKAERRKSCVEKGYFKL